MDDRQYEIDGKAAGEQAAGWVAVGDERGGMAVGVREFWQNWPKALAVESDTATDANTRLRVGICPKFPDGLYDGKPIREEAKLYYYLRRGEYTFKIGAARTHELWTHFVSGRPDEQRLGDFYQAVEKPLLAQCDPAYVLSTRAAGKIMPADPEKYLHYDAWMNEFLEHHLEDRKNYREYGMLNFGDWFNIKWDSWGNLEYDLPRIFFTQYLRSGDRQYFDRAEQAARHYIDVDVVHAVNKHLVALTNPTWMVPSRIWAHSIGHTGGYYARIVDGTYQDVAPLGSTAPYQIGHSDHGHHWMGGEFDYYLLTGDRRALEVARLACDVVAKSCPTAYTDHIRNIGWPLNMMLDAYEATGDKKYLEAASRQWGRLKQHLDLEKGWQVMLAYGHCNEQNPAKRCHGQNAYMLGLTLGGVARYHQITQDPEVLAGLTAGVNQLIRECYSEKHKSFYLTSCTHFQHNPPPKVSPTTLLASFAFAYESEMTGNREHRRILRESMKIGISNGRRNEITDRDDGQTGANSGLFYFISYALFALEED